MTAIAAAIICGMYDRGGGGTEGSLACPFLAFVDDHDARSETPDRRHRCYAEQSPAPRAIAHQQAYCLTPAFATCPTFVDWARREGARVAGDGPAAESTPAAGELILRPGDGGRGQGAESRHAPGLWDDDARSWAAPPPWLRGQGEAALRGDPVAPEPELLDDERPATIRHPFDEPWGTHAFGTEPAQATASPAPAGPPPFLAGRERREARDDRAPDERGGREPIAGRTGRVARDSAPGEPAAGPGVTQKPGMPATPGPTTPAPAAGGYPSRDVRPDGTPRPGRGRAVAASRPIDIAAGSQDEARRPAPLPRALLREHAGEDDRTGPVWEPARRRDAYPDLHLRMAMPRVPRLGIAFAALVFAGLVLFLAPTLLPSFFGRTPVATATPPAASPVPTVSLAPTPPPAPTPVVYTVAAGDTLSGIATRFGLTLNELLAANPQIKDANKLAIGDRVRIPARGGSAPAGSPSPGTSSAAP